MKNECLDSYLSERFENQIQWYDDRSRRNKLHYHIAQWGAIIVSASLPVLIVVVPENLKIISIVPSVVLAITTTALKTFKFQENWLSYRTIAESLKKEKHYYNFGANGYDADEDRERLFVERVEALISKENTIWLETHRKKGRKPQSSV